MVTDPTEDISENEMKPLRVYVADNRDGIFDVRGVKTIAEFNQSTIIRLAKKKGLGFGGVRTRFILKQCPATLPLRSLPNEDKISKAVEGYQFTPTSTLMQFHQNHSHVFLPMMLPDTLSAACVASAEAMCELIGLQPVAIMGKRFAPLMKALNGRQTVTFIALLYIQMGWAKTLGVSLRLRILLDVWEQSNLR